MKINHIIYTRFLTESFNGYDIYNSDNILYWSNLLKTHLISTLENQLSKDFKLCIIINNDIDISLLKSITDIKSESFNIDIVRSKDFVMYCYSGYEDFDYTIVTNIDCDDFALCTMINDIQSKVSICDNILLYGYSNGYTLLSNKFYRFKSRFNKSNGVFSCGKTLMINNKNNNNIDLDIREYDHYGYYNFFIKKTGINKDKVKFICNNDAPWFIWYRHENSGTFALRKRHCSDENLTDRVNIKSISLKKYIGSKNLMSPYLYFIDKINTIIKDIGLSNSYFNDSTGLSQLNKSTVYDLSFLIRHVYTLYKNIGFNIDYNNLYINVNNEPVEIRKSLEYPDYIDVILYKTGSNYKQYNVLSTIFLYDNKEYLCVNYSNERSSLIDDFLNIVNSNLINNGTDMNNISSYILIDLNEDTIVCSNNEYKEIIPMSNTKIATFLLALKYFDEFKDKYITVQESDLFNTLNTSGCYFNSGDVVSYKDLIRSMMISSSNQSANAISRIIGEKILENV